MRFDSYHPMINLIYFVAAIACTIGFDQPVFLCIAFVCAFMYAVKLNGVKALLINLLFLVFALIYGAWYASYNHFGVTILWINSVGNAMTLEAVLYGLSLGLRAAAVLMWLECVFVLITADKIVYLFGRISPRVSLFLSILLRTVPRIKERTKRIEYSREGIGKGVKQGNILMRIKHLFGLLSILITWTLEDFVESSNSMKSRGYALRGRTAFSIYRFDHRDRSLVIAFFSCLTGIGMAKLLNQTKMYYDPVFVMNRITALSVVFYVIYGIFLVLPLVLQIVGEFRFEKKSGKSGNLKK